MLRDHALQTLTQGSALIAISRQGKFEEYLLYDWLAGGYF